MRNSFTVDTGLRLVRTPNPRQQAARRRWMVAGAVVSLALAGGILGWATSPVSPEGAARTGPFSYFPS